MMFNTDKCEVLRITLNKKNVICADYRPTIHCRALRLVSSAKYLGVTIDSKLTFNEHINNFTDKANSTRAFVARNTRKCPTSIKSTAYKSFVRPQLEYASTAWSPHTRCNIDKIESVQRRAARSVLNDWSRPNTQTPAMKELHSYTIGSSSYMLQFLGWNSLEERRGHYSLVMMYIIVRVLVVIPTAPYLLPASYDTRGHSSKFLVPSTRVNAFRYIYFPATIMSWNSLPAHIIQSPSVECFKSRLAKFRLTPTSTGT